MKFSSVGFLLNFYRAPPRIRQVRQPILEKKDNRNSPSKWSAGKGEAKATESYQSINSRPIYAEEI